MVSRVLGGGVANRWLGRLRPVSRWLEDARNGDLLEPTRAGGGNEWRRTANGGAGATALEGGFSSTEELDEFFAFAMKRDRERAIMRLSTAGGTLTPDTVEPECAAGAEAGDWVMKMCVLRSANLGRPDGATDGATVRRAVPSGCNGHNGCNGCNERCRLACFCLCRALRPVSSVLTMFTYAYGRRCSTLVHTSRRFCSRDAEVTHKALIKQQRRAGGMLNSPNVRRAMAEERN